MKAFKKLFIKNYQDTENPAVRLRYGVTAGVYGIISNTLLCAFKLIVGLLSGSITIIADAVNNLSDAGSSVVTIIGFKLSRRPADKQHPFGHARYEYVTGLLVAILVLIIGVLLAKNSVEKIIAPVAVSVDLFTYIVLGTAIVIKFLQMLLYKDFGKSIRSEALIATGADSRNDILATTAALISAIVIDTTGVNVDAYFGIAVSLFIVISSIKLIKDTINPLLGEMPDKDYILKIRNKLLSYEGVLGIHDLMVHSYGEGCAFAIVHVEVDSSIDIMVSHDLMDVIERDFQDSMGIKLSIHMDPIVVGDNEIDEMREDVQKALFALDCRVTLHDFRVVRGVSHTNILFDALLPYDCKLTQTEIEEAARKALPPSKTKYYFVIELDRAYA